MISDFFQQDIFGMHIADNCLRIASLKKEKKGFSLESFSSASLAPQTVVNGEIKNSKAFVQAINSALKDIKGKGLRSKRVAVSLPEEKIFLRVIDLPKMAESEMKQAAIFEAENYIPMSVNDAYVDAQIITNGNKEKGHVSLVAAPKIIVDSYISCLEEAGLNPVILEPETYSVCRAIIKENSSPYPVLVIDVGDQKTDLIVFCQNAIHFQVSLPVSYDIFLKAISANLKVDMNTARNMIREYGIGQQGANGAKIFDSLVPPITDLKEQIKKYIDFYNERFSASSGKIKELVIAGEGNNFFSFGSFLSSQTGLPANVGNPWVNILTAKTNKIPPLSYNDSFGYSAALGLALRGAKKDIL